MQYARPGWMRQQREGNIEIPAGVDLVIEGVGAARHELAPFAQLILWIRSDGLQARQRGIERDLVQGRTREEAERFWDGWMSAEEPLAEQPWTRADLVVDGTAASKAGLAHVHVVDRRP